MGCGNFKDIVNINVYGKGKVGLDKNGNIKNLQVRGKVLYYMKVVLLIYLMLSGFNIIMQDLVK